MPANDDINIEDVVKAFRRFIEQRKLASADNIEPEVLEELLKMSAEKFAEADKLMEPPKIIATQIRPYGHRSVKTRICAVGLAGVSTVISAWSCFWAVPAGWCFGVIAILAGFAAPGALLSEFVSGAGRVVESQLGKENQLRRHFSFQPSVQRFRTVIVVLVVAAAGVIIGFASVYASISRADPGALSENSVGVAAVYFSVVTFATVGFGDIYAISTLCRIVVITEILLSWALLTITFSTVLSWIVGHLRAIHEERVAAYKREMELRQRVMKAAGLGLYGDLDAQLAEAKARIAQRQPRHE